MDSLCVVVAVLNVCWLERGARFGLSRAAISFLSPVTEPNLGKAAAEFYQTPGSDFCKERHQFRLVWCEVGT